MKALQRQLKIVKDIAEEAQKSQEYQISRDPDTLAAISVVEEFLRTKKRICYGGQAINAHLPKKYKFYKDTDLPDYDFFTPTPDQDIDELVEAFTAKGFREIGIRLSVHEGTTKLYINFMPMADITGINEAIYKRLFARAVPYDGIYYADPDFLRMMMYLELSRPAGEVGRWDKVYERLFLLNTFQPLRSAGCKWKSDKKPAFSQLIKEGLLETLIGRGLVIAGLDVYSAIKSKKKHTLKWFVRSWPLIAYSAEFGGDVTAITDYMNRMGYEVKTETITAVGEIVPECIIIKHEEVPIVLLVHETACHAYINMKLIGFRGGSGEQEHGVIKVAAIDTLITLFMSFIFHPDLDEIVARPILCLIHEMILYSMKARTAWNKGEQVPFLSVKCSGHQKQISTLLRERAERVSRMRSTKKKIKNISKI